MISTLIIMSNATLANPTISSLILETGRLIRQDFRRRAQAHGLTQAQWSALAQLHREPGMTQTTLAERLEVHPVTVTQLLERLVKAGWVRREAHEQDRRAMRVYLDTKAEPLIAELTRLGTETRERALAGITPQQRQQLEALLSQIKSNLCDA
ncbi:MarR family transcriptional regulator [Sinimarinibacterium sp. CAU 1509]|uniref:MarR family winged helix-turn-helix transcriptional regulator n=1 Tax=Sinimarinibacterium sp. CAU 1509 TaxID=2562283 RepID=UPI0010AC113F|nr:MarR family transcriptional regulator [Sinimarinibacterium sp. CAU 1509]TJY64705.1 MarR family transcriptional regulator [Sinimarinibacterium sp. CAU 1509]